MYFLSNLLIFFVSHIWSKHKEHVTKTNTIKWNDGKHCWTHHVRSCKQPLERAFHQLFFFCCCLFFPKFSIYLAIYFNIIPYTTLIIILFTLYLFYISLPMQYIFCNSFSWLIYTEKSFLSLSFIGLFSYFHHNPRLSSNLTAYFSYLM